MSENNENNKKHTEKLMKQDVSYPDPDDPELQLKFYKKREFYYHMPKERPDVKDYNDMKEYRDDICGRGFVLSSYQSLVANFINPDTPYKGIVMFSGLGVGKCLLGHTKVYANGTLTSIEDLWNSSKKPIVFDNENGQWKDVEKEIIVNSFDDETGKIIKNPVTKLYREQVNTNMREIVLDNGNKITITNAHKLLTSNGWNNVLHEGDYICVPKILYNYENKNNTRNVYNYDESIKNQHVSDSIMNLSLIDIKNFLSLFFNTNANINKKNMSIEFWIDSQLTINKLVTLLKLFGIYSEIKSLKNRNYLRISNSNLLDFKNKIGFTDDNKNKDLTFIINKQKSIINSLDDTTNEKEIIYAKIVKINEIKHNGYIYDLEVNGTHNFVAENILCHNTASAITIAERFKPLVSKYNTKIIILVSGPLLKENWKRELLTATGETYLKYQDRSTYTDEAERTKQEKNALIQALQYYKFMSYKSFYKHVIGEKITDRQGDKKNKATYRKTDEGEFERDIAVDRIYNLNNTLIIVDEAHNLTGNSYGDALKYIIKNSLNLKVLLLTATPMKNLGSDIVELVNFLRPIDNQIEKDRIFDSNKGHLMGFKEGGLEYLKNMMKGYVSHLRGSDPLTFAKRNDKGFKPDGLLFTKVTRCEMLKFQRTTYDKAILENEEDTLDRKSEAVANFVFPGLSADRKELVGYYAGEGLGLVKNQLKVNGDLINKKLSLMLFGHEKEKDLMHITEDGRSITGKILKMPYLKYFSIKFHKALKKLGRLVWGKKGASTAFVYSNLVKVGIALFHEILIQNGYLEFQDDSSNYQISPNTVCYFCGRPHFAHNDASVSVDSDTESINSTESEHKSIIPELNGSESSSDYKQNKKLKWEKQIPPHVFKPATFISITGKSSEESMEALPEDKKKVLDMAFNNLENRDGRYIKFVLGSRVMNEGISLKNVGEVHILDAYFNFGRVDQVVGRAIRHCSHYKIMSKENPYPEVNVYKYVVAINNGLSTEEELYKKAEMKYLLIKKIERAMKEVAIDCPLNLNSNMFKEEIDRYKDCGDHDPQNPCPAICDYTKCNFICDDQKLNAQYYDPNRNIYKKISKDKLDYSTFTHGLARNEIDYAKEKIKEMYILGYMYTLEEILEYVKNTHADEKKELFDEFFVFKALDELIPNSENDFNNYKDTILDKHNRPGYLIFINIHYIFQPFDEIEGVPMYYRTTITKHVNQQLSLYNYLKTHPMYQQFKESKGKRKLEQEKELKEDQPFYNFEDAMEYYDSREENDYVGFIDKEVSRRKNKSYDEIKDVFKLREKRPKILEKKRQVGLPSYSGSVCVSSKSKKYLEKLLEKLGGKKPKSGTRMDICQSIEDELYLLEKYSTGKDKLTFLIVPTNHPSAKYSFPLNLQDRVENRKEKIKKEIGNKVEITVKQIKKTSGPEKGMNSYELHIKDDDKIKDHHEFLKKMGFVKEGKEMVLLLE